MNRIHLASSLTTARIDCQFEQVTLHRFTSNVLLWTRNQDQTCRAAKYSLYSVGDAGAIRTPRPALPVLPRCGPVLPSSRPSSAREWRCMLGNLVRPARVQYSMSAWSSIILTGVHAQPAVSPRRYTACWSVKCWLIRCLYSIPLHGDQSCTHLHPTNSPLVIRFHAPPCHRPVLVGFPLFSRS